MNHLKKIAAIVLVVLSLLAVAISASADNCTHPYRDYFEVAGAGTQYQVNANDKNGSHLVLKKYRYICVGYFQTPGCWKVLSEKWMGSHVESHSWLYSPGLTKCGKCGHVRQ